jgi:Probable cobalt transporter subunit (CbtA)
MTATQDHSMTSLPTPSSCALMAIAVQKGFIARGLFAGAVGGFMALAVAQIIVAPVIAAGAIPVGNRGTQTGLSASIWMACAVVAFGVAMGGLLAVAFAVSWGRLSSVRPRNLVLLLAADAFAALSVLPSVNYPPTPVSVRGDETATRIGLYLLLVGMSLALIIGAVWVGRRLAARIGSTKATLVCGSAYAVVVAAAIWLLPPVDQTLKGLPTNDVNTLRLSSLATHLVLWASTAAVFAPMASKLITARTPLAVVLWLDDYRERLASPAQIQATDSQIPAPSTYGGYEE